MSQQMILPGLPSAIFSRASGHGHTPCAAQGGRMTAQSGQAPVPASLSVRQANEKEPRTSGTCGPHYSASSASAELTQFLASRLQALTALHGSTLYRLTWKQRTTPAGRSIPALRASAPRTSGSGCTGWPTPCSQDGPHGGAIPRDGQAAGSCSNVRMADAAIGSGRAGLCDLQKGKQRGDLVTNRSAICGLADASERGIRTRDWQPCESIQRKGTDRGHGFSCGMDNAGSTRLERYAGDADDKTGRKEQNGSAPASGGTGWLEHSGSERRERGETTSPGHDDEWAPSQRQKSKYGPGIAGSHRLFEDSSGPTNGFWGAADWLFCQDGKWRPVEPGTFPLADGTPQRVGRLRGYGNAIVAPQAAAFITAFMGWKHAYRS